MIFPHCTLFSPPCTTVGRCCPMPTAYTAGESRPCIFWERPRPTVGCWRLGLGSREKLQVDFLRHWGSVLSDQRSALLLGGLQLSIGETDRETVCPHQLDVPIHSELGIFGPFKDPQARNTLGFLNVPTTKPQETMEWAQNMQVLGRKTITGVQPVPAHGLTLSPAMMATKKLS